MNNVFPEEECLRLINEEGESAYGLVIEHAPELVRKFKRVDKAIRELLKDAERVFPDACFYTASGGFNLMLGNPHSPDGKRSFQELLALSGQASIQDGDF